MKVNKNITLDVSLAEKLKREANASQLIEILLIAHYNKHDINKMSLPELEKLAAVMELEEKHKREKEELENGFKRG